MRIISVSIKNFRCYYGTNKVDFNNDGKITLICGLSGHGKSSFLNFFRWMFYGDPDFGKHNDKPLFNELAYKDKSPGDTLEIKGEIFFEHLGVKYSLIRKIVYTVGNSILNASIKLEERTLYSLINDNWEIYDGNCQNKINSIMPHGLSKYFYLAGERAVETVLDSSQLKKAIHTLFDLDKYQNALDHLGREHLKKSLIGYYNDQMTKQMSSSSFSKDFNLVTLQESLSEISDDIEYLKKQKETDLETNRSATEEKEEILKLIGRESNKSDITNFINLAKDDIKRNDQEIIQYKRAIGKLFYNTFPYLLLSRKSTESSAILRVKNRELKDNSAVYYENLRKELLSEILAKGKCICGKDIDQTAKEYINNTLDAMPPNSLTYLLGQFVSAARDQIRKAKSDISIYSQYVDIISKRHLRNHKLEQSIKEKEDALKMLSQSKDRLDRLEELNKIIASTNKSISSANGDLRLKTEMYKRGNNELQTMIKNDNVYNKYTGKINFLKKVKSVLEEEKRVYENQIKCTINECVRYIFKALTTQTAIDTKQVQFIKEDFSLRTTFLTGGQLAVEVYSYIIGITKALQELKIDTNENPIIIDAPFAFTDSIQSEHLVRTLPRFSKQTILLTLDISKILKHLESETSKYEIYLIDTDESQLKSTIKRSDLNEIKKEMLNK